MALSQNGKARHEFRDPQQKGTTGLTFAEAYLLRKAKEEESRRVVYEPRSLIFSLEDFYKVMKQIKQEIQGNASLKKIKHTLKSIPSNFAKHITEWCDEDKLDILHHAIINDKPSVVTFLLAETNFFSPRHTPQFNPYAHLAAMAGHAECLKTILHNRPSFFFASEKPCHDIRLPDNILRKLKSNEKTGPPRRNIRLLEEIKMTTKDAEKKIAAVDSAVDVAAVLDKELGDADKFLKTSKLRLPVHSFSGKSEHKKSQVLKKERHTTSSVDTPKKNVQKESKNKLPNASVTSSINIQQTKTSEGSVSLKLPGVKSKLKSINKPVHDRNHFIQRLNPASRGHLITVFWDLASQFEQGVVCGAGKPVQVQYAPDSHLKPNSTTFDTEKKVRYLHNRFASGSKKNKSSHEIAKKPSVAANPQVKKEYTENLYSKRLEIGVRGSKRYKQFQLRLPTNEQKEKEQDNSYMQKTPLTYAAEKGHEDCVQIILNMVIVRRNPTVAATDPITLATKARSPETIILLMSKNYSRDDLQNAVLLSIREMYPDCLTALLSKGRARNALFGGVNLFHILFSQCVISGNRYELMPEMTQTLVSCKEDVNASNVPMTFPMYTLINSAFNITTGKQIFFFVECLHILLKNKANPHFDEAKQQKRPFSNAFSFSRRAFTSAINCIFGSAKSSLNFFEKSYWSKLFMKKFVTTIEMHDRTHRRQLNDLLFEYMEAVCELGLDKTIVRCLLRYGGNPDHMSQGKYAVNVYFDRLLPYMTKFEVFNSYEYYSQELDTLMILCKQMSRFHLRQAMFIFLQDHLLSAPIQALPITRSFAARMDHMMRNPRTLSELSALTIWIYFRRNKVMLNNMPWPKPLIQAVLP